MSYTKSRFAGNLQSVFKGDVSLLSLRLWSYVVNALLEFQITNFVF